METYPCPACGGPATAEAGCRRCGRPHDPDAAALALFQRTVASLEQKKRELTQESLQLRGQLAHASAQRDSLRRAVRQRVEEERSTRQPAPRLPLFGRGRTPGGPPSYSPRATRALDPEPADLEAPPRLDIEPTQRTVPKQRPRILPLPAGRRPPRTPRPDGPEATSSSMQASVLGLGGLLLAGAAIVLALDRFGTVGSIGRLALLALITTAALAGPLMLIRRGLTATAETVASVALLLVLLDGYVVRDERLFGSHVFPLTVYMGLVCAATAAIAAWYSVRSHLIAPRYATLLALQPVLPLLAYRMIDGPTGWALTLSGVAVLDLALGVALGRSTRRRLVTQRAAERAVQVEEQSAAQPPQDMHSGTVNRIADEVMRDLAWTLFAVAFGAASACGIVALATTETLAQTLRAAMVVIVTAVIGVTGSLAWRRGPLADVASGIATVAVIAAFARVGAVALPGHTLLFLAAAVALAASGITFLPADARRGPRLAVTAIALATALLLVVVALPAIAAPLRAVWPVWEADLGTYEARVAEASGTSGWQLVMAALLLTATAVLVLSGRTRTDQADVDDAGEIGSPSDAARVGAGRTTEVSGGRAPLRLGGIWLSRIGGPRTDEPAGPVPTDATTAGTEPDDHRPAVAVAGVAFAVLVAPAGLNLGWFTAAALTVLAAIAAGVLALTVRQPRTAWICLGAAAVLGGYAAAVSLARPTATALTLTAITIAGAAIALTPRPARTDPQAEVVARRVTDGAAGGALFALPGAAASAAAIVFGGLAGGATAVLVLSFLALAVSLGYAAITQVARQEQSPPLLIGATAGAVAVAIATVTAAGAATIDLVIGLLMLVAAIMLWLAPRMDDRHAFGDLTGSDAAAAAVTIATIGAVARAVSLAAAGIEVVTLALLVFAVAVAARGSLPEAWRRGPVAGAAIVGGGTGLYAGIMAVVGAVGVIRAANPPWRAPLGAQWMANATEAAEFGWQVPIALLLLAGAAAIGLPQPYGDDTASAGLALTALAAPVGLGLGWQSPMVLGWLAATAIAAWAAWSRSRRAASTRLAAAGVAGLFAAGASLVRPGATAGTLGALGVSAALIAALAWLVSARRPERSRHAILVGGAGVTGALLAMAGTAAAIAGGLHQPASTMVLTGTLAAAAVGLGVAGLACQAVPRYLPFMSVGVAAGATITAVAALVTQREAAIVYAAAAALLGVLAELVRANGRLDVTDSTDSTQWVPARGFRPDRTSLPVRTWQRVRPANSFAVGVTAAAGIPAAIVVVFVAPAVMAALVGPYRWISRPWTGDAATGADLGAFERFAGNGTHVLALAVLTIAGALMAVGLGGDAQAVANRSVAVIVPGASLTLLIMPSAFDAPWPVQPTLALLVATMAGLGLALTLPPPPESSDGAPMRVARRVVFVIAILAAGAGAAGSLATRTETLSWLAGSVFVGAVAGWFGRTLIARVLGWHVAASTAQGFAVAAGLAAGLPLANCAFALLTAAALLLVFGAALPRLRPRHTVTREAMTIEAAGYTGALISVALTINAPAYTAAVLTALGAILGLSAARPGRTASQRTFLIIAAAISELIAIWLLLSIVNVALTEAYTLPFAILALITGLIENKRRPELGSWVAYGPALIAGFLPTLAIVLTDSDTPEIRRVLLIVAAVATVAVGAVRRQKAPVAVGSVVTVVATLNELLLIDLPWWTLLLLFTGTGVLLISLGATYEQRRRLDRLRGAYRGMR